MENVANIKKDIMKFITDNRLLAGTSKVYIATSGGADSMALLSFMYEKAEDFGIEIGAVHVNHGIRGETARRDAEFVREFCNKNNIEYVLFDAEADKVEVPDNASEEWARQLRYNYFSKLIMPGVKIATAHTLSDQTETVIFRLARGGSGLNGLSGIPIQRDGYIRPFLCISRAEVEKLVESYGTGNITDETNLGDTYSRNKIRHNVIPVLKDINPGAEKAIEKFCVRMEKTYKYIAGKASSNLYSGQVIEGIKYETDVFIGVNEVVLDEMLIQLLSKIGVQSEQIVDVLKEYIYSVKIDEALETSYGILEVNKEVSIQVTNWYITVQNTKDGESKELKVGTNTFGRYGYQVKVEEVSREAYKNDVRNKRNLCLYATSDNININSCVMRGRKPGDRFKPACRMDGKLVRLMREYPLAERDSVPIIEIDGKIIWVWGVGFTDGHTPIISDLKADTKIFKVTWDLSN